MVSVVKRVLLIVMVASLGACAAGGAKYAGLGQRSQDKADVIFYRPDLFRGSISSMVVYSDGVEVARVKNGGWLAMQFEPGTRTLQLRNSNSFGKERAELKISLAPGDQRFVRVGPLTSGALIPLPTMPAYVPGQWGFVEVERHEALNEMVELRESK